MAMFSFALKFCTTEEIDAERDSSVNKETLQGFVDVGSIVRFPVLQRFVSM